MPAMLPAAAASTALGSGVAVGAFGAGVGSALGTGLALGAKIGGAGGIAGLMGGLGGMGGAVAPGAFGALAPAVATKIAPAAASQLAGTIGAGVAPGAFGANLAGAAAPGLTGTVGSVAPGAFGANLAGAGQGLAGAYNPATAQTLGAKFLANSPYPVANANNLNFLNSSVAGGNTMPLGTTTGTQVIDGKVVQGSLPPFNAPVVSTPNVATNAVQTANPSGFSEAGFRGINPNYQSALRPAANTMSETGQLIADPRSEMLGRSIRPDQNFMQNLGNIGSFQDVKDYAEQHPYATSAMAGLGAMGISKLMQPKKVPTPEDESMIRPYTYERTQRPEAYATSPTMDSSERNYFNSQFIAGEPYKAAEGGIASAYAVGGPVEQMATMNSVGTNTGYPMANLQTPVYSNPAMQRPEATNVIAPSGDVGVGAYTGEPRFAGGGETKTEGGYKYSYDPTTMQFTQLQTPTIVPGRGGIVSGAMGNLGTKVSGGTVMPAVNPMQTQPVAPIIIPAYQTPEQQLGLGGFYDYMNQQLGGYGGYAKGGNVGGESHLGDYSDGGRLLKGPGDGVSDSIPASIGGRQPARLADGEFVVPARIVSELGNGSTEAGARKLYAMMERIQKGRRKSVGKGKVAVNSKADKHLPA